MLSAQIVNAAYAEIFYFLGTIFFLSPCNFFFSYMIVFVTKFVTAVTNFVIRVRKFVTCITNFVIKTFLYDRKKMLA